MRFHISNWDSLELRRETGPGLLESAYESALAYDLIASDFDVKRQVPMPFIYKELKMDVGYRIDLMINDKLIIEIKSSRGIDTSTLYPSFNLFNTFRIKAGPPDQFQY